MFESYSEIGHLLTVHEQNVSISVSVWEKKGLITLLVLVHYSEIEWRNKSGYLGT